MLKLYRHQGCDFGGQDVHSWDQTWEGASIDQAIAWAHICHLRPVFDRYFPRSGRILEGGCGIGQFVTYYRQRGYDIEGVDFSAATIAHLKDRDPALPVSVGDVTALAYPDGYFQCYYSGGVVEHFEEGPFRALTEARRVLSSGGKLIVTVPFANRLRRMKQRLGMWSRDQGPGSTMAVARTGFSVEAPPGHEWMFSEYYFTLNEFKSILDRVGFRIVEARPCDVEWGEICQLLYCLLRRSSGGATCSPTLNNAAIPLANLNVDVRPVGLKEALRSYWKTVLVSESRDTTLRRLFLDLLAAWSGHMLLFVCEPTLPGVSPAST